MNRLILYVFTAVLFVTCSDPIFYTISQEEKKLDPKIPGSPTNFVFFKNNMYVASGDKLYRYNGTAEGFTDRGKWYETKPGGKIFDLAATDGYLYIICEESDRKVLKQSVNGSYWTEVPGADGQNIHSICSANNQLFIGAGAIGNLYILNLNGNNLDKLADTENLLLNGAAFNGNYYLIAKNLITENGGGIFTGSLSSGGMSQISSGPYIGIINLENPGQTIVAIDQNGRLYDVSSLNQVASLTINRVDYPATGALAVWEKDGKRLLLAGRQDLIVASTSSGYTYGYLESEITSGVLGAFREPGGADSSINEGDNEKYKSSLGIYPINYIIQSPINNESSVIFASTQKQGVYSYRERKDNWSWNAEQ